MQEPDVRGVLHIAASAASMPEQFLIPSQVVQNRQPQSWWRRPLVPVILAALAFLIVVVAVPETRVLGEHLAKGFATIWAGKLGGMEAEVRWADTADIDELNAQGQGLPFQHSQRYKSIDEAAAAAGFRPAEPRYAKARLVSVDVQWSEDSHRPGRLVLVPAQYLIGSETVYVVTSAEMIEKDGNWQVDPYQKLVAFNISQGVTNVRAIRLGQTEAIAYEMSGPKGTLTVVSWLQNGLDIGVSGQDEKLVLRVARATAK